jgi:hypothetical protein
LQSLQKGQLSARDATNNADRSSARPADRSIVVASGAYPGQKRL